jgi:hypothetical protein
VERAQRDVPVLRIERHVGGSRQRQQGGYPRR